MKKGFLVICLSVVFIILGGCLGSSDKKDNSDLSSKGTLSVGITDAPLDDAENVNIIFTKIEIFNNNTGAWITYFESTTGESIDLLQFRNGKESPFTSKELDAGDYGQVRIFLKESGNTITTKGSISSEPLLYNKGIANTGLKLTGGFKIEGGKTTKLTIDFDVRKSIVVKGGKKGGYYLKPTARLVATDLSGKITIKASTSGSVYYLYKSGTDTTSESAVSVEVTDENGNTSNEILPFANALSSAISFADPIDNNTLKAVFSFIPFANYDIYLYDENEVSKLKLVKENVVLTSTSSSIIIE